jgi:hypothetical protein
VHTSVNRTAQRVRAEGQSQSFCLRTDEVALFYNRGDHADCRRLSLERERLVVVEVLLADSGS